MLICVIKQMKKAYMENNFVNHFRPVLDRAVVEMQRFDSPAISCEHLVLACLRSPNSTTSKILEKLNVPKQQIIQEIEQHISDGQNNRISETVLPLFNQYKVTISAMRFLKLAAAEARKMNSPVLFGAHLLLALLHDNQALGNDFLRSIKERYLNFDITIANISEQEESSVTSHTGEEEEDDDESPEFKPQGRSSKNKSGQPESPTPALDKFGIDMTKAAAEGKLDPVVGRNAEIERIAQILSRRKKNNPVLIGEPGVGKSAIVEGLALRINQKKVSRLLLNKRVVALDMAGIVAGTKYRGQFEERIKTVLDELVKNPDIIVFIDEIHTIVGAGGAPGSMDAANMLKPALARGEIQCIGATTLDEYRKNIEKDGALERRFQKVIVEPTSAEETLVILQNVKDKYEAHHNVTYTDDALQACVNLTDRYISDRNFPDKALDALDEAGSRVHITEIIVPEEIRRLEDEIDKVSEEKITARKNEQYELAARLRDRESDLKNQLKEKTSEWENSMEGSRQIVDGEKVAEVVAMMTGVPTQRIAQAEGMRLLEMGTSLHESVIGQDDAITKIVKAIQRNRIGLKDPNKPIGTFLFLGPTGVGKTYLAKKLAEYLFDSPDALIRIDMSEYMEKFTVSRLVGAPPGYVGYEEGGQLTEKVRRRPYSVVLLDEIEKAHPDVFNLLLQVLDEGRLTDSLGRRIDFKNTILIMTSNVGSRQLKEYGSGVGFNAREVSKEQSRSIISKALNRAFSPEFLNRIDDIITFNQLEKEDIFRIIDIELKDFHERVGALGFTLELSEEARNFIAEKGYDVQYGARPLKRALQKYLEDELAELLLHLNAENKIGGRISATYTAGDEKIKLSYHELVE